MHFQHATDAFTLKNGVKIPCIGFGTWQSADGPTAENAVREAIEAGYRHIDTAAIYRNERSVGRGIKDSGIKREDIFVTSKVWNTCRGYQTTLEAFEKTLSDLRSTTLTSTSSIGRLRLRALQTGRNSTLKPGVLSLSSIRLDASVLSASPISARRTLSR